ncbi:hypothetical protein ACPW7J_12185 [Ihubacter sp. rT4E-8]|uniref:hypothetical protein n=1 Tax=Ihubacter sp. rT4E-8 TaxID=3242369 RepID=UPI003CF036E7
MATMKNTLSSQIRVFSDNSEYIESKEMEKMLRALDEGEKSGELVDEADVYKRLGVEMP